MKTDDSMSWKISQIEDNGFSRKRFAATKTLSRQIEKDSMIFQNMLPNRERLIKEQKNCTMKL